MAPPWRIVRVMRMVALAVVLCACGSAKPPPPPPPPPPPETPEQVCDHEEERDACAKLARTMFEHRELDHAEKLAVKACDIGSARGCTVAGMVAYAREPAKSHEWFTRGCDGQDQEACGSLGALYLQGIGVPHDVGRAIELLQPACSDGVLEACNSLGLAYSFGQGIRRDLGKAIALFERACNGGNPEHCRNLAIALADGDDSQRARVEPMLTELCNHGDLGS